MLPFGQVQNIDGFTIHYNKLVGRGGFATCYDCDHQTIQGPICVKIIQKIHSIQEEALIDREIEVLKALSTQNHKNIIKIFHIRRQHYFCYIFMEKHQSGNLTQYEEKLAKEGKSLTLTQILKFLKDIIEGYHQLHSNKIIHRDLKPENLLYGNDGHIKICDFGLGKFLPNIDSIQQQTIAGTPCYSAPQVLMNDNYSNKCDVYSLGITIFKLVFKYLPFPGQHIVEVLSSLANLKHNQINIPNIHLQGTVQQKQEIKEFLRNSIVFEEDFRSSWDSLFLKFLRVNPNIRIRVERQQINTLRQQSADPPLRPQQQQAIQRYNQEVRDSRQTIGVSPSPQQRPLEANRTLRRISQFFNIPNTPNSQIVQIFKLVEIIFSKLNLVSSFIQKLEQLKQRFRFIFLTLDLMIMKFYLIGYQYSLLLNIRDSIQEPRRFQELILICILLKAKRLELNIQEYNSCQEQQIINQKTNLFDRFEQVKNLFQQTSNNLNQQLLDSNEDSGTLKQLIDKTEQSYNYLLFIEEFKDKFVSWKKRIWGEDSNMILENLRVIAYGIKISLLETEYPVHTCDQIDPASIVFQNGEEDILRQYIQDNMPY